ncbi:LOW QUALITY PROTEIN: IQ motif-containing protein H [Gadus morhua]|uniref:LOW QUALITY PROTEIN: IQ motif-containing protein H n=1 Tax=Gadus morhua TaxID=8049 RepID=UPI0011B49477|nr:LOW QUALITY PROTEIN: IQ domain-containing protein H [Gadus morhua]
MMTATLRGEEVEELGRVIVQVQEDLRQLRREIVVKGSGEKLDLLALDKAILRTECGIRKHAEQCLKAVNNQMLVLPNIEDKHPTSQIPKWGPPLENIPNVHSQWGGPDRISPGEKHKLALTMRLLYNPAHPKTRTIMNEKFGIPLPDVHKKSVTSAAHQGVISVPRVGLSTLVSRQQPGYFPLARPEAGGLRTAGGPRLVDVGLPLPAPDVSSLQTLVQHKAAPLHAREAQPFPSAQVGLSFIRKDSTSRQGDRPVRRRKQLTWSKEPGQQQGGLAERDPASLAAPATHAPRQPRVPEVRPPEFRPPEARTPGAPQGRSAGPLRALRLIRTGPSRGGRQPVPVHHRARPGRPHAADFLPLQAAVLRAVGRPGGRPPRPWRRCSGGTPAPGPVVNGERLADVRPGPGPGLGLGHAPGVPPMLATLDNQPEVLALCSAPGQRYRGEGGAEAAAVRVQAWWRGRLARADYVRHRRRVWAGGVLALALWRRLQMRRVRELLQARRRRQLENHRQRAQHLAANWKHIHSSTRTIIHIPSLGYSQSQRSQLKDFGILQNTQISRLADIRDPNVDVIYVAPRPMGKDVAGYYARFAGAPGLGGSGAILGGATQSSQVLSSPLTLSPVWGVSLQTHSMCLSTLLKYSPHALRRIRNLVQGRRAYIVGGVAHADDLAVADELGVAILGPEPDVARRYGTKSGGRGVFTGAEVAVPPGHGGIHFLPELHETLARLMTHNMEVQRWIFKMDAEFGGRGTAYCDVCHLGCHGRALQEYRRLGPVLWSQQWTQEHVVHKLCGPDPCVASPPCPACQRLCSRLGWLSEAFLRRELASATFSLPLSVCPARPGGLVEAYPPSTVSPALTVDLLLEPGGSVSVLSCCDQLHGACRLETLGSCVPQASVRPRALHALCSRVGRACLQSGHIPGVRLPRPGHLPGTTCTAEQKVWAIDLDLRYSDQLALTQLLLLVTGATLDCRSCRLLVPLPTQEKSPETESPSKHAVGPRYAVLVNRLLHTNLSIFYHSVFFSMCKAHGIGYDTKRKKGTVFVLHDSSDRHSIGMLTVGDDLLGSLVTFARNLSVIHQEISSPKTQGDTNFKDLLKDIEGVLQMAIQNKEQALEAETS